MRGALACYGVFVGREKIWSGGQECRMEKVGWTAKLRS